MSISDGIIQIGPGELELVKDVIVLRVTSVDPTAVIRLNGFKFIVQDAPSSDMPGLSAAIQRGMQPYNTMRVHSESGPSTVNPVIDAAARIPPGFYLKLGVEEHRDDVLPEHGGREPYRMLHACLYQEPPEEGWIVCAPGIKGDVYHQADKHRDKVLWSISAGTPEDFERLLVNAINKRWPSGSADWLGRR